MHENLIKTNIKKVSKGWKSPSIKTNIKKCQEGEKALQLLSVKDYALLILIWIWQWAKLYFEYLNYYKLFSFPVCKTRPCINISF